MSEVKQRLSMLEEVLAEYIIQNGRSERQLRREISSLSDEMKEFKDEMKEFKDEMKVSHKEMKKQWGDLANKMGTLVEDIIAPAVRPMIREYFKEEPDFFTVRTEKHIKKLGLRGEFDVIAATESYVFLVETKSSPKEKHLNKFDELTERFRRLFPEFDTLKLIPVFASLRFEDEFLPLATKKGIYLLAYREWEYMDILNFEAIQQKEKN